MKTEEKHKKIQVLMKRLFLTGTMVWMLGNVSDVQAKEQVHVIREANGDLEELVGIEISDQEADKWIREEKSSQNQSSGQSEQYPFLDYGSDYGYQDMALRSNTEGRQYLYRQLLEKSKEFTVNGEDAGIIQTSGGNQYFEAITVDLSEYNLSTTEKLEVYFTFRNDNPQFFWLSNSVVYSGSSLMALTYDEYQDGNIRKDTFDEIVNTAEKVYQSKISGSDSLYKKVLTIHDILIADIEYSDDTSIPISHSIAGAMTSQKSAVCEGYAKVMQVMMNGYGIENIYVTGIGNGGGHAWNMVCMNDGKYYWLDATWDDQAYELFQHRFFLVGNANFGNHIADTPSGTGTSFLYALPETSDSDYVYDPNLDENTGETDKGDINADGTVNLVDLMMCLNHVGMKEMLEGETFITADVNSDGTVDLVDLMRLLNYVGQKSTVL